MKTKRDTKQKDKKTQDKQNLPSVFFCPGCLFLFCPECLFFCPVCVFFFVPTAVCLFCPVCVFFVPLRFFSPATATLPMRMGRLGFRSAERMVPAAFWASWADLLPMIADRLPQVAAHVVGALTNGEVPTGCLGELKDAAAQLDRAGFMLRPDWAALRDGARPPLVSSAEPGEWQHGWHASEHQFRETMVLSLAADAAHLRSHSGPGSSSILLRAPTHFEFRLIPEHFRTLVLEKLRLPLSVVEARCQCGLLLDSLGRHRAACPRSGRLRRRAVAPERTLARVCREAGATVRCNAKLREMNVEVAATDERAIEVLAFGLPLHHGAQLAVDITLRSALTRCGNACDQADRVHGIVASRARRDKENKYAELLQGDRCRLVVVGMETGGRWSTESLQFVGRFPHSGGGSQAHALTGVQGFEPPSWEDLAEGARPPFHDVVEQEPGVWRHGWQHEASSRVEREHREVLLMPRLADHEKALLRSQSGPFAGMAFSAAPASFPHPN